mmetsp:Transcript_139133/g.242091  ORF Transcript_139133/g.242091 Transcript_139133/m.242091 type:complete len:146 (-) Transcript_139133:39-476(-)
MTSASQVLTMRLLTAVLCASLGAPALSLQPGPGAQPLAELDSRPSLHHPAASKLLGAVEPAVLAEHRGQQKQPIHTAGLMSASTWSAIAVLVMATLLGSTCLVFAWNQDLAFKPEFRLHSLGCLFCTPFVCCFPIDERSRGIQYD